MENVGYQFTSTCKSELITKADRVGAKITKAIIDGHTTLDFLTEYFWGSDLAPRSLRYRKSPESCRKYTGEYIDWLVKNRWIKPL